MPDYPPVVIVGACPVGCVLALCLAKQQVPVVLLERADDLAEDLRASTFHPPTLEMLDKLYLTERLISMGVLAPTYQYRDRRSAKQAIFDLAALADETRHPYRLQCDQFKLTRLISEELKQYRHVTVQFGSSVARFEARNDAVDVTVAHRGGD